MNIKHASAGLLLGCCFFLGACGKPDKVTKVLSSTTEENNRINAGEARAQKEKAQRTLEVQTNNMRLSLPKSPFTDPNNPSGKSKSLLPQPMAPKTTTAFDMSGISLSNPTSLLALGAMLLPVMLPSSSTKTPGATPSSSLESLMSPSMLAQKLGPSLGVPNKDGPLDPTQPPAKSELMKKTERLAFRYLPEAGCESTPLDELNHQGTDIQKILSTKPTSRTEGA